MYRVLFVSLILLPMYFGTAARATEAGKLRAGAAAVDISPITLPALVNGGFLQRSANRIDDPLFARALVVSDGEETIALVVVDSCMLPTEVCDSIKHIAAGLTGIRSDRILITATHTHSAPSAMAMCLGCDADEAYVQYLPEQVARAIALAHDNCQPARLGWAIIDGSDLTNCRRWITRSDRMGTDPFGEQSVRAMMHPGYQNPNYTSPAGPIDPWLSVLSVVAADDESPICTMANLSMHFFGAGEGFSADYFGDVNRLLEKRIAGQAIASIKTGDTQRTGNTDNASQAAVDREQPATARPAFVGIMSQGTSGDLHWMNYSQPQRNINRQQYAEAVAERVLQALETIVYHDNLPVNMAEQRIVLERRLPSLGRREWARPINAARGDIPPRSLPEVYAQQAEWIHEHPQAEVVLQALRIGELAFTAMPTETYAITGLKLKRQSPFTATINLELSNGAVGYIPPPEQHRLGGYTTWPARTAGLAEHAEPLIVETLLGLLESVSGSQRRPLDDADTPYSTAIVNKRPLAYWRLEDMDAEKVRDKIGDHDGHYHGGVALFLPDADAELAFTRYGNRCVYLAGGHIAVDLDAACDDFSLVLSLNNQLPADARGTTGMLVATDGLRLSIAGSDAGDRAGVLLLEAGQQTLHGERPVATGHWQHIVLTRSGARVRIYLDGDEAPEIDVSLDSPLPIKQLSIGSDGVSTHTFDGKVDELALFSRELAAAEVQELYHQSGLTPPPRPKPAVVLGPKSVEATAREKYAAAVDQSQPLAFWRLHDARPPLAADAAGQFAARYEPGAGPLGEDTARPNFTGGRVKAQVPNLGTTYSVEFWFRNDLPTNSRPVTAYLFSRAVDGIVGADGDNLGLGGTHASGGRLLVFNGNGRNELLAGVTPLSVGSWSHVVMVRDHQRITVYLNGDPTPEIDGDLPIAFPQNGADILLGGRADNFANLQGMLEEVAIYDRGLTPQEVQAHFEAAEVKLIDRSLAHSPTQSHGADHPQPMDADHPQPMEIEQSLQTIHVREGYEVQVVACEPLVLDPVDIDWGPDGKLWVAEMADYPLGMDGHGKPGGRVRFLEDTNHDGAFDTSTLFAEQLPFPTGIMAWGQGVLVTAAPEIVYLEDSTGDGVADIHQVLYSGFLEGNQQLRVNGLRWGLDNWIYCASGSHHGGYGKDSQITAHQTGKQHHVGSRDFRIRPATGQLDPQSGPSQYGRNRDDWGNWFGVQNSYPLWHYVLADHHIRRNPHFAPPDPKQQVVTPANPPVYPASKLEKRFHSFEESGRFTSACSAMIYRDNYLFPDGAEHHAFTCEPFHNLVQHNLIAEAGVSFTFRRDPAEQTIDFFASEDRWCRPVMVRTGPDGALWVVDMYRYMIEHPEWLPQNGQDELRPWFRSGDDRGRIYRIVRSDHQPRPVPRLHALSQLELIQTLESSNGWQRDTAQRLLVETRHAQDTPADATSALMAMLQSSSQPLARLHAMWTLEGRGELPAAALESRLTDNHPGVRRNAVQIAAENQVNVRSLAPLVQDIDAKVRLELASTLGAYADPMAATLLAELVVGSSDQPYIVAAVMSSLNADNASQVLLAALYSARDAAHSVTAELVTQAMALSKPAEIANIIQTVTTAEETVEKHRFVTLAQILDGLVSRPEIGRQLSEAVHARMAATIDQARRIAADSSADSELRSAAVRLLARSEVHRDEDVKLMRQLLTPQTPDDLQRAVVGTLARRDTVDAATVLLAGWKSHGPQLRHQILEVLSSRPAWSEGLRKSLEEGLVQPSELSTAMQQQLLQRNAHAPAWQRALATQVSTDRLAIVRGFEPALALAGNHERGEAIYRKLCIVCHQLGSEGSEVGPQLASVTDKSKSALLHAILDPNASIEAKYYNYAVLTTDGRTLTGRLETETGSSITLVTATGKRETILRRDIEELKSTSKSLMPEGLEQGLSPQDMADLLQFVGKLAN
jgi:putative membrane-bound dehydrogenase-like protein